MEGRLKTANTSLAESEAKVEALEVTNSELEKSKAKEVAKTAALKKSLTEDLERVRTDVKVRNLVRPYISISNVVISLFLFLLRMEHLVLLKSHIFYAAYRLQTRRLILWHILSPFYVHDEIPFE